MPKSRKRKANPAPASPRRTRSETKKAPKFVGRAASPVLERYPPKDAGLGSRLPAPTARPAGAPPTAKPSAAARPASAPVPPPLPAAPAANPVAPPRMLIALERPFDLDEFAGLLGETVIRTEVPREDLAEALRRVSDFMGFGIYVYAVRVRPAKEELLKRFVLELQRVDFDPATGDWVPFADKGRSDSPFGPTGDRH